MIEGKLIKFYREKAGLTQGQLCEGICSATHLSKIEREITEYSGEITHLLSQRLNICLDDEFVRYHNLQQKLKLWHNTFVMQQSKESEILKKEIEKETLIQLPDFQVFYQLLSARYYLSNYQLETALLIIQNLQKNESSFSPQDRNMLKHVLGMYYFHNGQYRDCIQILTSIDQNQYNQFEYYYHLALAYHLIHFNIISYYYAEKVLDYFQKTLNVIRIIDTETIMLLQLNAKELHDFEETKERYEQLIRTCDTINEIDRKSKLLNNLAFELYRRKKYKEASELYKEAMKLMDEKVPHYLTALDGYINTCYKGKLFSNEILLELAHKGLRIAKSTKSYNWIFFELHLYQLNHEEDDYYHFIETTALPFFKNMGFTMLIEHYEKKLFHFYNRIGAVQKALDLANSYIQGRKSYYDHE
ncbi:helix-turn-helix transcriptional regulator [Peribacillus frigoritolerans]|uniref:helix-turn-helix domain-containing protein n=1 Tax=Peribacillus frigoritolerans TaxID=450367 RepID=UPI000557081B|nr:helix-turn-helix transcriptional regulator [Peribacillus frigoritolerans]MCK2017654.1 helix-turn-helix domain-containing protein [Peribacillus frigoritolerans]MEB2494454.1 helix-turn-helix transcriptional regulator [Peribacillus frigoritolerans]MED3761973.1 helix-turn-helix transcriptional regulator [Peribacillus frigoritolerans]WHY16034.1 helix-turn-helix transcriptional regulator [Peribacillus frigoritolerans]